MLIGICGSICSGKGTVARYLVDHHGFRHVSVQSNASKAQQEQGISSEAETNVSNTYQKRPSGTALVFPTSDKLLEYVTQRWRERWVTADVMSKEALDAYSRRPFFLLISVDAPLLVRWKRYQKRKQELASSTEQSTEPVTKSLPDSQQAYPAEALEDFVTLSDAQLYHPETGQATHISSAPVRLLNTSSSLAHLYVNLGKLDLLSTERLRPGWDNYFMTLASLAARRSNCMKRRVGCVVVSHNRRVISTGYNGTPRGIRNCGEGGCSRCNQGLGSGHGLATCLCIHAEENALLEAGRDRLREGAVLYCDTCPCLTCSIKIAQVGISEVVYAHGYSMDTDTAAVFREAGVRLRQFVPPADGLIHFEKMEFLA
ncbi:putative deoxycytidylate deaminase [Diaporthe ampelina]|uniref:Deoxycytidylate deaminase n=1 Tax=Diaporthe ampelina TaxID=1214573 RepID=A0A0G2I2S9_9PEZI|nr:putative deoxycytidylate deaminase [Diaporthe ampelina]